MSAISWNESVPSPTSAASSGDDEIRSFVTSVALGLQPSFYWPGSGGGSAASAGESQLGNLRMAHASTVTGGYPDGFLLLNPTRASVHHVGSSWTGVVGHSGMLDYGTTSLGNFPQRATWLCQEARVALSLASRGSSVVTFPISYSTKPAFVSVNFEGYAGEIALGGIDAGSLKSTGFTANWCAIALNVGQFSCGWTSEGTVAL